MEIEFKIFPVRLRMYKPNNLFSQKVTTVLIQRKNCAMRINDCAQYFPLFTFHPEMSQLNTLFKISL